MIEFKKVDDFGLAVFLRWKSFDDQYLGKLEPQEDGTYIYNCHAEINYTADNLEKILLKIKDLEKERVITQQFIKELLNYDSETGIFTWAKSKGTAKKGKEAGWEATPKGKSYRVIMINGKGYFSHRLAWLYVYGYFPDNDIDHINGAGLDNRIINLRDVSESENLRNRRIPLNNKSGVIGVSWEKLVSKWRADISINGKKTCLGFFDELDEAAKTRKDAEIKHGYHENHGSIRPL